MLCAISGEAPQQPVASRKSGNVFEKRLIEAYIAENGTDPVTGEDLTVDDLIELKSPRVVKPRGPKNTSIPSLLASFQSEWDAVSLEAHNLRQQLAQTRQELSSTLYEFEGATRHIGKLTKERDEARVALSSVNVNGGDAMQVVGEELVLPEEIVKKIDETQEKLSKTRRKRPVPEDWATPEVIEQFDLQLLSVPDPSVQRVDEVQPLDMDSSGNLVITNGTTGDTTIFEISSGEHQKPRESDPIRTTAAVFWNGHPILGQANGAIKVFNTNGDVVGVMHLHTGPVTGLTLHPCGDLLASVSEDKSYIFYDLNTLKPVQRVATDSVLRCGKFHPDGHLFACGGSSTSISIYTTTTGELTAELSAAGPVVDLSFSENGTWLAYVTSDSSKIFVYNLRNNKIVHEQDMETPVRKVEWDYTGQYLAVAGHDSLFVEYYDKGSKGWRELLRKALNTANVQWGPQAEKLVAMSTQGALFAVERPSA